MRDYVSIELDQARGLQQQHRRYLHWQDNEGTAVTVESTLEWLRCQFCHSPPLRSEWGLPHLWAVLGRTPRLDSEMESMVECIAQPIVDSVKNISGPVRNPLSQKKMYCICCICFTVMTLCRDAPPPPVTVIIALFPMMLLPLLGEFQPCLINGDQLMWDWLASICDTLQRTKRWDCVLLHGSNTHCPTSQCKVSNTYFHKSTARLFDPRWILLRRHVIQLFYLKFVFLFFFKTHDIVDRDPMNIENDTYEADLNSSELHSVLGQNHINDAFFLNRWCLCISATNSWLSPHQSALHHMVNNSCPNLIWQIQCSASLSINSRFTSSSPSPPPSLSYFLLKSSLLLISLVPFWLKSSELTCCLFIVLGLTSNWGVYNVFVLLIWPLYFLR